MAYPTSIISFVNHNAGDIVQPSDVNTPDTEIVSIETDLINGMRLAVKPVTDVLYNLGTASLRWQNVYSSALQALDVASRANYLTVTAAITGSPVLLSAAGTDTNIDIKMAPKGTGKVSVAGGLAGASGAPWWGITPSGSDDTAAINTLLANASGATPAGGDVFLGPGTFTISGAGLNMATNVRLRGAGINATTLSYSGTGACINFIAPAGGLEQAVVADLLIAGTSGGDSGLSFSNNGSTPARILVQNVKIQSFSKSSGSGGAGVRITAAIETTFDRVDCSTNYNGWDISGNGTTTIALRGCIGRSGTHVGCYLHTGVRNVLIGNESEFSGNAAQGIYVLADSADNIIDVSVIDSWVEGNDTGGTAIGMVHVDATSTGRVHNFVIERTYITAATYYAGSVSLFADHCDGHAYNILVDAASPATNAINIGTNTIGNGFALQGIYNTGTLPTDPNSTAVLALTGKLQTGTTTQTGTANRLRILQSMAKIEQNVAQTLATASVTTVAFTSAATVTVNTDGMWTSGSPTQLVAPITGKYILFATITYPSQTNGAGQAEILFNVNGGNLNDVQTIYYPTGNTFSVNCVSAPTPITAAQVVLLKAYQTSGGNVTVSQCVFGMIYVGE